MLELSRSYERVNYLIRPSKQVERKLFVEAMHRIAEAGYPISEYTYIGMGSVFYADFLLFHKYLYIDDMICCETAPIPKRMSFNLPYDFVDLKMIPISHLVPELSRDTPYVVWLDYDRTLDSEVLQDVQSFSNVLAPESILIVTVEAEPRLPRSEIEEDEELTGTETRRRLLAFYRRELGRHMPPESTTAELSKKRLPRLLGAVLRSQLKESVTAREGLAFFQLFNFRYADNAQMLTIGGMIEETSKEEKLGESGVYELDLTTKGADPVQISVPYLTVREKNWLDRRLPTVSVADLEFELEEQLLENYKRFYRHYPIYYEALL